MTHLTRFGKFTIISGAALGVLLVTAALAAVVATPDTTRTIYFAIDQDVLQPEATRTLRAVAQVLRTTPGATVSITGHTCSLGNHDYNMQLSRRRSDAAAVYLAEHENIPVTQLQVAWYGPDRPALANLNLFNRQRNRRVELAINLPGAPGHNAPAEIPLSAARGRDPEVVPADAAAVPPPLVERTVSAAVFGPAGQPITGLTPSAFTVREDGILRTIVSVREGGAQQPGSVALLLDRSSSMCLIDLHEALRQFAVLMSGEARIILATADERLTVLDAAATRATLNYQAYALTRGGETHLHDALLQLSTNSLAAQREPRVLVLFSDGMDEAGLAGRPGSVNALSDVIAVARRHNIRIATVELGPTFAPGRAALKRLAQETGGVYLAYDAGSDARQFAPVFDLLGMVMPSGTYTIRYRAPAVARGTVLVESTAGRVTDIFPTR